MRILVYGASEFYGGTESYLLTLYKNLDTDNIKFDFLYSHNVNHIPYVEEIESRGGKVYKEYYQNSEKSEEGYISIRKLFDSHPEWDGVYVNLQKIHTGYRLLVEAHRRRLPYRIIHAHNSNYSKIPSIKDKIYELYFHLTKRKIITHFLACSNLAGRWMFKNCNLIVIPNAVQFDNFECNTEKRLVMREKYNLSDKTVVGFCGRLTYQKNPEFLIEVFAEIRKKIENAILLIVGDGEERDSLYEKVSKMDIKDCVIFTGAVNNVEDYMQMMDCFILPSRYEGFGIVLLEAQAAGLKCYATDKVVPHETNVGGSITFIDKSYDAKEWAQIIVDGGFDHVDCLMKLKSSDYSIESMKNKFMRIFSGVD